jgi:hypothetical protein
VGRSTTQRTRRHGVIHEQARLVRLERSARSEYPGERAGSRLYRRSREVYDTPPEHQQYASDGCECGCQRHHCFRSDVHCKCLTGSLLAAALDRAGAGKTILYRQIHYTRNTPDCQTPGSSSRPADPRTRRAIRQRTAAAWREPRATGVDLRPQPSSSRAVGRRNFREIEVE